MACLVCAGATLKCSMGTATSSLTVSSQTASTTPSMAAATTMDYTPLVNIMSFGMCSATTNPLVIAATAAASGVSTPATCIPATSSPWTPGSDVVTISNFAALTDDSTVMCTYLGTVEVTDAGQTITTL